MTRRPRGRPAAPDAIVVGRPLLTVPTGALAHEIVEILADALVRELTKPGGVSTVTGAIAAQPCENTEPA